MGNHPHSQHFNQLASTAYAKCEKFWSYGGKIALIGRNLLNAAARSPLIISRTSPNFPNNVKVIVTHMKLLSIISIPFNLVDLSDIVKRVYKSFLIKDSEGLAMASIAFTLTAADTFDATTTFVNSLFSVLKINTQILAAAGLPIGFTIVGIGTVSRIIHIAKTVFLHKKISPGNFSLIENKNRLIFKKEFEKILGIGELETIIKDLSQGKIDPPTLKRLQSLTEKKKSIIQRMIPKNAAESFENIISLLNCNKDKDFTDQEIKIIFQHLDVIRTHLEKKLYVEVLGLVANIFVISALVLFSIGNATALPFLLMAIAFAIRLSNLFYQNQKIQLVFKQKEIS